MKTTALEFFGGSMLPINKGEEISVNTRYYTIWEDKYIIIPEKEKNYIIYDFIDFKDECTERYFNYIENDKLIFLKDINVIYDDKLNLFDSCRPRPAYWMRGKPVSPNQALEIISKTDNFFDDNPNRCPINFFDSWWFDSHHYPYMYGWCRPDGRIGLDSITQRWPNAQEFVVDSVNLLYNFPYLNMIFIIWNSEEESLFSETYLNLYREKYYFADCFIENISSFIECGLYIHDNCIELLNAENTWNIFYKYNKLYGDEPITYNSFYNMITKTKWIDEEYFLKCLEVNKLDKNLFKFEDFKCSCFDTKIELQNINKRYEILK